LKKILSKLQIKQKLTSLAGKAKEKIDRTSLGNPSDNLYSEIKSLRNMQRKGARMGKSEAAKLLKGSLQRRNPFNPENVDPDERYDVKSWTDSYGDRADIPQMQPEAKQRGMHKLHGLTQSRQNESGEMEFLLHRGMNHDEHEAIQTYGTGDSTSSWTPHVGIAQDFASHYQDQFDPPSKVVSAWIPESQIHHIPNTIGGKRYPEGNISNSNHSHEQEVIVKPHRFNTVDYQQPDSDDTINSRISARGKNLTNFRSYAKRRLGKKEELEKGSLQRRNPFNPIKDVSPKDRRDVEKWHRGVGERSDRDSAPSKIPENATKRGMHKLHGLTQSRQNESGEREFLLHRGAGAQESGWLNSSKVLSGHSSWTPKYKVAERFASMNPHAKGNVFSAWIPESQIAGTPNAIGEAGYSIKQDHHLPKETPAKMMRPAYFSSEQEVIVKPHKFNIVDHQHPDDQETSLNSRVNLRGSGSDSFKDYAERIIRRRQK